MFVCVAMLEQVIDAAGDGSGSLRVDPFVQSALVDDAIDDWAGADLEGLDDEWFARYARSVDEVRSRVDAMGVAVAAEAERRGHDRATGFFSTKSWIKHHVQLTGPEAHGRMQTVRLFELVPAWAAASDHSLEWAAHGATVPRNGGTMCGGHNLIKERHGFTARRQADGEWIIRNADGDPIN